MWIHGTLSVAGVVPAFGVVPDAIDWLYTAAELPFGKSTWTDLALATAGILGTVTPVAGDGAAAVAKMAARGSKATSNVVEGVNLTKRVVFNGTEVRAIRDLSHVSDVHLNKMAKEGVNPYNKEGERLIYHHLGQRPEVVVMIPQKYHVQDLNPNLHPYGNIRGAGLGDQARLDYKQWRKDYNIEIAIRELERRAAGGATTQTVFPNYNIKYPQAD